MAKIKIEITDQDIIRAEDLLLPVGSKFNDERREFLKCMESCDVIACPGSGKTTALLAKILILSWKMPLENNSGICVLTHTNVAIDEITRRIGSASDILFRHPNFFGTIQKFVDSFLCIPAYGTEYGKSLNSIDGERFKDSMKRLYEWGLSKGKAVEWLKKRYDSIDYLCKTWLSFEDLSVQQGFQESGLPKLNTNTGIAYSSVQWFRNKLLEDGYLDYKDAFSLGMYHLKKYDNLRNSFRVRFPFVFLDETQDTMIHQLAVLAELFDAEETCFQRLGDPNQAIFDFDFGKSEGWTPHENLLKFSDSHRFGSKIVNVLSSVRVNRSISLKGKYEKSPINPYIISYDDSTILSVLPRFSKLILKFNLNKVKSFPQNTFIAVGSRAKNKNNKVIISSYFPGFSNQSPSKKTVLPNLISYLVNPINKDDIGRVVSFYRNNIINGIIQSFYVGKIRNADTNRYFTPKSFLVWLADNHLNHLTQLKLHLAKWIKQLHTNNISSAKLQSEIIDFIRSLPFDYPTANEFDKFLSDTNFSDQSQNELVNNIFRENDVSIELGTVHSVKGETHTAALYLETYYNKKTDFERLLPFFIGEYPEKYRNKQLTIETLKLAHVALSRPTHLLAFACHENNIEGHQDSLKNNGWEIITADE